MLTIMDQKQNQCGSFNGLKSRVHRIYSCWLGLLRAETVNVWRAKGSPSLSHTDCVKQTNIKKQYQSRVWDNSPTERNPFSLHASSFCDHVLKALLSIWMPVVFIHDLKTKLAHLEGSAKQHMALWLSIHLQYS